MNFIKNMKAGTRMILSFILILLLLFSVGALGIVYMGNSQSRVNYIYNNSLASLNYLHQIYENSLIIKEDTTELLYVRNKSNEATLINEINSKVKEDNELFDKYIKIGLSDAEKSIINQYNNDISIYRGIRDSVIELTTNNKYAEAVTLADSLSQARSKVIDDINKLIDINKKLAEKKNIENHNSYNHAKLTFNIIITIAVVLSIVLAYTLTRYITNQLIKVKLFAMSLGNGDLTSNDEFENLSKSLNNSSNSIKDILYTVQINSNDLSTSSKELSATVQEINAAIQEISNSLNNLLTISKNFKETSKETENRALLIRESAEKSTNDAKIIYVEKQKQVLKATKSAEETAKAIEGLALQAEKLNNITAKFKV